MALRAARGSRPTPPTTDRPECELACGELGEADGLEPADERSAERVEGRRVARGAHEEDVGTERHVSLEDAQRRAIGASAFREHLASRMAHMRDRLGIDLRGAGED